MSAPLLLAALTVVSMPGVGCPEKDEIEARLGSLGVSVGDTAIDLRFSRKGDARTVAIESPGWPPRTLEHEGADCSSLREATLALLSVLLDERRASPPHVSSPPDDGAHALRLEAGALVSSGLVASLAAGAEIGVRVQPVPVASFVLEAELWPERTHPAGPGTVTLSAGGVSLGACAGPAFARVTLDTCLLGFAGAYSLSASSFPVVHPTTRLLLGGEVAVRAGFAITRDLGVFVRGGLWAPVHPLDVVVRGGVTPFAMPAFGLKAGMGAEVGF